MRGVRRGFFLLLSKGRSVLECSGDRALGCSKWAALAETLKRLRNSRAGSEFFTGKRTTRGDGAGAPQVENIMGQGMKNEAFDVMADLRDKVAEGEILGWWAIWNDTWNGNNPGEGIH